MKKQVLLGCLVLLSFVFLLCHTRARMTEQATGCMCLGKWTMRRLLGCCGLRVRPRVVKEASYVKH